MKHVLTVEPRAKVGSKYSSFLRASGIVPGVVYGEGSDSVAISVAVKAFEKTWKEAGETSVITLEGLSKKVTALIHDVAVDPLTGAPIHVDFLEVRTDKPVEVEIPLEFTGVAPAEKELGGTLVKVKHAVVIEALPQDLPSEILVDVASLKTFDDQVLVKDLVLPKGVTVLDDAEEVLALVQAYVEEVVTETPDIASVAVEKRGKEDAEA
jgi:large subunit ribosomal protein L25